MNVLLEFFDTEQIENVYASLNFKFDKVYYFGQRKKMTNNCKEGIRYILEKVCEVSNITFVEVSEHDYNKIIENIERVIIKEKADGNMCYLDITGGQDLVLAAMGAIAERHSLPMFQFDIVEHSLLEINMPTRYMRESVAERHIKLDLDQYIRMCGGAINYGDQKENRNHLNNSDFRSDVRKMYDIAIENPKKWNAMSGIIRGLKGCFVDDFRIEASRSRVSDLITKSPAIGDVNSFIEYMDELKGKGLVTNYINNGNSITICFKSLKVVECILDAGCMLELEVYYECKESGGYNDCKIGVHVDWDGIIHGYGITDVENEIDVMVIRDNIPTFISCKNNDINQMVLYEIDTIAGWFSKKYIKREVVTTCQVREGYKLRAEEMGINIIDRL